MKPIKRPGKATEAGQWWYNPAPESANSGARESTSWPWYGIACWALLACILTIVLGIQFYAGMLFGTLFGAWLLASFGRE